MSGRVLLVMIEHEKGEATPASLELLGLGRRLAEENGSVTALCLGSGVGDAVVSRLIGYGADEVIVVDHPLLDPFQADAWLPDIVAVARELDPEAVLFAHTHAGAELSPRLAILLDTTVATGSVAGARSADGALLFTRPCYGGNAMETVSLRTAPAIATIKPKAHEALPYDDRRSGRVVRRQAVVTAGAVRTRIVERSRAEGTGARLETANVVVSGGRGLGGPEGFVEAKKLAELLDGAVGATRVACDLGWCPKSWQIGLSGRTVTPDLYIALGISGAGQHMSGCGNARVIVAVNTDIEADIFRFSRFGIVADCRELLPELIEQLHGLRS